MWISWPFKVVPARIGPAAPALLDAYVQRGGVTRSEAVRQLIEAGLVATAKAKPGSTK